MADIMFQYDANRLYLSIKNIANGDHGIIPNIYYVGENYNLKVNHGDWVYFDHNEYKVCVVSDKLHKYEGIKNLLWYKWR